MVVILLVLGLVVVVIAVILSITSSLRRQGYTGTGAVAIVRSRSGHLFTTIWLPLISFRSVRLGAKRRYQRCPVCLHWEVVELQRDEDLSEADREQALAFPPGRLP